jgi:hypothetical protein
MCAPQCLALVLILNKCNVHKRCDRETVISSHFVDVDQPSSSSAEVKSA